jgi:hypothetical protein
VRTAGIILVLLATSAPLWATPEDADRSEEKSRASFVDQFTKFMQDKNVQGRPKTPEGKVAGGGKKTRFNGDDGLAFQSDLTYHDNAFNAVVMEAGKGAMNQNAGQNGKPPEKVEKVLHAFVSQHGGLTAGGGSSLLERTAYQFDQQYADQDAKNKNQPETPGVKNRSIFKITTKEVFDNGQGGGKMEKDKVDRYELRDEVKQAVDKVGVTSSETILQAARGEGNENDPQALGNGVLLRAAANEASKALWNSTLANLSQRRINRAIRAGGLPFSVQTNEGAPKCEVWAQEATTQINNAAQGRPPEETKNMLQDVQRMLGQCKQVAGASYNMINPAFKQDKNGGENLQSDGTAKEDSFQRDSRIQLEILAKAGKSVTEVPSNWQYGKDSDKARMTIEYDDGQAKEGTKSMSEQIESYNVNLKQADDGYKDVATRLPGMQMGKPLDYAIQPGTRSIVDINQPPASAFEEVGIKKTPAATGPVPQTYDQLLQRAQTN